MFNFLFKKKESRSISLSKDTIDNHEETTKGIGMVIGEGIPMCPNCHKTLKKFPGAKTKCPICDNFMFVRTRYSDRKRVLVTKDQAEEVDLEWSMKYDSDSNLSKDENVIEKERSLLRKRFGREPSIRDIHWSLLTKQLLENAKSNNWGLYRNTLLSMGDLQRGEMKLKEAIKKYLEVCYLDLNGPENNGPKRFDPTPPFSFLAPGIIRLIKLVNNELNLSLDEIKNIFLEIGKRDQKALRLPISPEKSWPLLKKELENRQT